MNLNITGLNFDVTDAVRSRVSDKLQRIIRHSDDIINVTVTLSHEKNDPKAAANVHLAGKDLHVEHVGGENMYAAIDTLMDKLDRAVVQHKEKSRAVR